MGKYLVGARLAAGGTASVYLARLSGPHNFERLVALKIIHEHLSEEQEFVDMFLDEANLASRLSHPNIVHVYELAQEEGTLFMAMEYLHGQPLSQLYKRANERGVKVPHDVGAWSGAGAAHGLHHAHELRDDMGTPLGLVHRDVSPQNIFITYDGQVKVVDFGIARAEGRIAKTAVGQIKGKFSYMAPEQALGHAYDHRSDLFALGATLYEVAVGARLFKGEDEIDTLRRVVAADVPDPRIAIPDFPDELDKAFRRALVADPDKRYATAEEMGRELDEFVEATGARDQRERIVALMGDLFGDERVKQEAAVQELRRQASEGTSEGQEVAAEQPTLVGTESPLTPRRKVSPTAVIGGVVGLGAIIGILGYSLKSGNDSNTAPVAAATAPKSTVVLDVTWKPDVPANVQVDGRTITERPATITLKRSGVPVEVKITAEGYESADLRLLPNRDQSVVIPLTLVHQQPVAGAQPDPAPTTKKPPDETPKSSRPSAPRPATKKKVKQGGGVIDDNPFD